MMFKDATMGHYLIDLYSQINPDKKYLREDLEAWREWGFSCIDCLGNLSFEIIKGVESLTTCRLIELSEDYLDSQEQTREMTVKFREKELALRAEIGNRNTGILPGGYLIDGLLDILKDLDDPDRLGEFYSFMKLLGHPYVDPVAGSEAIRELGQAEHTHSITGVKAVEWSFCHIYTRGYLQKKAEWPPIRFSLRDGKKTVLQKLCEARHPSLPLGLTLYDPSDWDFAHFIPHEEFDYGEDVLSLLSDTALSFKRSEVDCSWADRLPYRPKKATSSNRVLEEILTMESPDARDICDRVAKREIPYDWKIVTVCPKEREMKRWPRMFAMMVFWMRYFFALTEKNIAKKIFPYIPEQTMTMTEVEKTARFLQLTNPTLKEITISFGIDFSKWCSHFNEETVDPIGRRFGQITGGYGLFDVVHWFFGSCIMILRHPAFRPRQNVQNKKGNLVDEPGIFSNCHSGLEGICQKLWTTVTLSMLHWSIWKFGLIYDITCQGDNLVLYVRYRPKDGETGEELKANIRLLARKVVVAISDAAALIGHEVKPEECSQSTGFATYGKDLWFRGRLLETSVKSLSRMIPMTSADVPSFFQVLSNVSASGVATSPRVTSTIHIFLFTKFVENWLIRREFKNSLVHGKAFTKHLGATLISSMTSRFALLLSLVPSNLGGLPVSTLAEFLYRGHSDPLSSSLASIWTLRSIPVISKFLDLLQGGKLTDRPLMTGGKKRDSWEGLINDPFSIPLTRPPTPGTSMASSIREVLLKKTTNKQLAPLIRCSSGERERSDFFLTLSLARPIYPKVLHEIYKASSFGVMDNFSKRFTNTRTLYRLARNCDINVTPSTILADRRFVEGTVTSLAEIYKTKKLDRIHPYSLLSFLRSTWGLGDLQGVTTYHPLLGGQILSLPSDSTDLLRSMSCKSPDLSLVSVMCLNGTNISCQESRGPIMPYLGNLTSDKSVSKWMKPLDSSPPLKDVIRLLQIARLITDDGSNMRRFIEDIVASRTQFPVDYLYRFTREKVAGSVEHRLNLEDNSKGSFLSSISTWASHLSVSTDLSGNMGNINYPVSFHEFVLSLVSLTSWAFGTKTTTINAPFGLVFEVDLSVMRPIDDHKIELAKQHSLVQPLLTGGLYYLTVDTITLSTRSKSHTVGKVDRWISQEAATVTEALAQIILAQYTQRGPTVRRNSYVRAEVQLSPLIDMPECTLLTGDEYLDGLTHSVLMAVSKRFILSTNKNLNMSEFFPRVCFEACLIIVPRVLGTVTKALNPESEWGRLPLGGKGYEKSILRWCLEVSRRCQEKFLRPSSITIPCVFSMGLTQMSSDISNRLHLYLLKTCLISSDSVPVCKKLSKVIRGVLEYESEMDRLHFLTILAEVFVPPGLIKLKDTSPQMTLRLLRCRLTNPIERNVRKFSYVLPDNSTLGRSVGTELLFEHPRVNHHLSRQDIVESWTRRPYPRMSDAYLRWAPIFDMIKKGESILIIGIGNGGVLECIPEGCSCVGVDLSSVLRSLGHSYTHYEPPILYSGYRTHDVSWVLGGDILEKTVSSYLLEECRQGQYSRVLIDVESVTPADRIEVWRSFVLTGVPTWVKIQGDPSYIVELSRSVCSVLTDSDSAWIPWISVGTELIFGGVTDILPMYRANGRFSIPSVEFESSPLTGEEINDSVLVAMLSYGGLSSDLSDIESFLHRETVDGHSLLALLLMLTEDIDYVFETLGRVGVRNLICLGTAI
jgi:hypothetical protein